MTDYTNKTLLPAGLRDVLPPDAAFEAGATHDVMAFFARHGYDRVRPPLIEFEESLLSGSGAAMSSQTFRVMDPLSQRMMGVRADMTLQVARIATSRLSNAPRPLRLAYAGQVLRVKGSQLRPARQFGQAGIELIGATTPAADAEVVLLAAEALMALGVAGVSVDLNLPTLVPSILAELGVAERQREELRLALDRKDAAVVAAGPAGGMLSALLAAVGPADRALSALESVPLPARAAAEREALIQVATLVREGLPDLALTIDPVEHRGFEYHAGVSFAIFARGAADELGRGGRYHAGNGGDEPATGATLFMDAVLETLPPLARPSRLLIPAGTSRVTVADLQRQQWVTVAALDPGADLRAEALRLGCSHAYVEGHPVTVNDQGRSVNET
ncbi:MAG: ATP phosphoribosyltransferase regulatory subunit [Alphaproteobacteria bacterium]